MPLLCVEGRFRPELQQPLFLAFLSQNDMALGAICTRPPTRPHANTLTLTLAGGIQFPNKIQVYGSYGRNGR
jgi:hypothetical protein